MLDSPFRQPLSRSSLVFLLVLDPLLHTPCISSPSHHLLFAAHVQTIAAGSAVIPMLCHHVRIHNVIINRPTLCTRHRSHHWWEWIRHTRSVDRNVPRYMCTRHTRTCRSSCSDDCLSPASQQITRHSSLYNTYYYYYYPPRPQHGTVSVTAFFTIVFGCVTDCNCNL